ncbi:MAG: glycoside hydrolase, partial [Victivallales bacterium]|nr:glycoside hydrolase [Victivallales bacterium]
FSYIGRRLTAPWRAAAARRIERVRKGDLSVRVVDRDGQPVKNAAVHVRMKRHAFGFGSAVRVDSLCADTEDGRKYRQFVLRHFNKVTIENALKPKWWPVAQTNAHEMFRRERTDRALAWLNEHGIEVRGHCTTWAPLNEKEAIRYTGKPEELRRDLTAHMREKLPAVGERVGEWDVVNHIVTRGVTLGTVLGGDEAYADIIRRSRGLAPGTELWVNEGSILHRGGRRDDYAEMLRFLVGRSAAPDGIGFMAHFRSEPFLTPPERLFDVCERFATIIPNLQLTELDIWTGKDEELQADYLRDVMIVAFSHPAVQGVVMWGFWAGNHWKPDLVLYRRDWSKKPAAVAWEDLVFRRWWTEESGKTGPDGFLKTRGFLGDYEIAVERAGTVKKTTSVLEGAGVLVTVPLD